VLAEEVVDLLDGGAGAEGDALAAAAVDDGGVVALLGGHGVDDGLDAGELGLVDIGGGLLHAGEGQPSSSGFSASMSKWPVSPIYRIGEYQACQRR